MEAVENPYVADAAGEAGGGCRKGCAACSLAELGPVWVVAEQRKQAVATISCYLVQSSAGHEYAAVASVSVSSAAGR